MFTLFGVVWALPALWSVCGAAVGYGVPEASMAVQSTPPATETDHEQLGGEPPA